MSMATTAMALICFVSSNPSPQHWLVSGRAEAVARLDAMVATLADVRRIVHAEDGDTGFSRYELAANPSNRVLWPLISTADREKMVMSRFQHIVPSCPSGERSSVGTERSRFYVGLIGSDAAMRGLGVSLGDGGYAIRLEDGRTGQGIALRNANPDIYDDLLRRAAEGRLDGVDLVLMRRSGDIPPAPERPRRIDHMGADADRR